MPHANPTCEQSAAELKRQIELERDERALPRSSGPRTASSSSFPSRGRTRLTIGRGDEVDVSIEGDEGVSRLHAELELVGGSWLVVDDGLSTTGRSSRASGSAPAGGSPTAS